MTDIGTHYEETGEAAGRFDGHPVAGGRRLLARFFLPLDMGAVAKSLLLFASAYPGAVLDNPHGDGTTVDIYDRPAANFPHVP